jgi:hypothetical protein
MNYIQLPNFNEKLPYYYIECIEGTFRDNTLAGVMLLWESTRRKTRKKHHYEPRLVGKIG